MTVELNPGTPGARMLLDQPRFNFDDQASVPLAQPVRIGPGDTIRVTCTHDASLRAPLPELEPLAPRYLVRGDGTRDVPGHPDHHHEGRVTVHSRRGSGRAGGARGRTDPVAVAHGRHLLAGHDRAQEA
jgi:hypothetical protein